MMGDSIRYLLFLNNRWRWRPTAAMRARGLRLVTFGRELTAADKARALALNDEWDRVRRGQAEQASAEPVYPIGSYGNGYQRAMKLREAERVAKGKAQTTEQEKRDDWPRAWRWLSVFADCDPRTIQPEHFLAVDPKTGQANGLVPEIEAKVSATERHRVIKVHRALWKKLAAMNYCDKDADPSLVFANTAPPPRQDVWQHREVVKLVQRAWRENKRGLAAVIATAWDTMLSPIDVRKLTAGQRAIDKTGAVFFLDRAKTGRAAAGTLTPYATAILETYIATLGCELLELGAAIPHRGLGARTEGRPAVGADALFQGQAGKGLRADSRPGVRSRRAPAARRFAALRSRRGRRRRRHPGGRVEQDGQHDRGVEPAAQDLQSCEYRFGAALR